MDVRELAKRIGLDEGACEIALSHVLSEPDYQRARDLFWRDAGAFAASLAKRPDPCGDELAFYLRMAAEAYPVYRERGIGDKVFDDTFRDIAIWARDYREKHGRWGLDQLSWIGQSVRMELFRLGRLQFEPIRLEDSFAVWRGVSGSWEAEVLGAEGASRRDGAVLVEAGSPALNVHIAAEEPLDVQACLESFDLARSFFGNPDPVFVCDSWLLSPELGKLLPEESNIMRFQRLFAIAKVHHTFRQAEERVFGFVSDDPSAYPEGTSLQRSLKEYLASGREPGIGLGIIVPEMRVGNRGRTMGIRSA